ncbi:hypothetical protein AAVH_18454 [Aphelenchoides avenae]|nr:hypothetical protein AAVH_18454 [Aphelenchus avenae]
MKKERKDSATACERTTSASTSTIVEEARTPEAEGIPETSVTPTTDADTRTTECDPEELELFYSCPIRWNRPTSDDQHKSLCMFLSKRKAIEALEKLEESPALRTALFGEAVPDPYGALRVYR